jgi:apoptosis-inducing factor 3
VTRLPGAATKLRSAGRLVVAVDGAPVLLVHHDAAVYATQALCSHRGAPLVDGAVLEGLLVCAWHRSAYRLRDGSVAGGPAVCELQTYPVEVQGDDLVVGA